MADAGSARALQRAAEAELAVQAATVRAAEAGLAMAAADLQHAEAAVQQQQAALDQAEVDLDRTVIRAPIDGVVIGRDVDRGQTVAATLEAPTLFTIAQDLRQMEVHAKIDEADIGRIRVGQPAGFTVDAHPGRRFSAAAAPIISSSATGRSPDAVSRAEEQGAGKVALIGATVAKQLFGKDDPVGGEIRISSVPFEVVGVLSEKGPSGAGQNQDDIVFVPISTAKLRLMGSASEVNREAVAYILVKAVSDEAMRSAQGQIEALLRQRHRSAGDAESDFQVNNPAAAMAASAPRRRRSPGSWRRSRRCRSSSGASAS